LVVSVGVLTAGTGGAAAPLLAGVATGFVYDAATTGMHSSCKQNTPANSHMISAIEFVRHHKFDPQGYLAAGTEVTQDWRSGLFDTAVLAVGDRWAYKTGVKTRTTKV
jgi:hypothetical protein